MGHASVRKEMALTPEAFFDHLRPLLAGLPQRHEAPNLVLVEDGAGRLRITANALCDLRMGQLQLPATEVILDFEGYTPEARHGFLRRFERRFQRGGG